MKIWIAPLTAAALLVAFTSAADYYRYETESGTVAFTDDLKQVPKRYRADVERLKPNALGDYPRLSVADSSRSISVPRTSVDEPDRNRPASRQPQTERARTVTIEVAPGILVDVFPQGDEPIRVEEWTHRWEDGILQPYTIVRQGDRVLLEIKRAL